MFFVEKNIFDSKFKQNSFYVIDSKFSSLSRFFCEVKQMIKLYYKKNYKNSFETKKLVIHLNQNYKPRKWN